MRDRMARTLMMAGILMSMMGVSWAQPEPPLFTISPYGGTTNWADEFGLENRALFGGRAGILFKPWFGVEGTYGQSGTEAESPANFEVDQQHLGLDAVLHLLPSRRLAPYLTGGWGQLTYDAGNDGGDHVCNGWEIGAGFTYRFHEGDHHRTSLRVDVRDVISDLTPFFQADDQQTHNLLLTAGLQVAFGRSGRDGDGDGVKDRDDLCPDTPLGATIDVTGCPRDSDGDGVFDGLDACANTPARAVVDATGCPRDSDGDGVHDGIDACPGTPSHLKVDEEGCPLEITETEIQLLDTGKITVSDIRFASGSAELESESYPILAEIGQTLSNWPELRIEIGGHTDAQGASTFNQELSERRAQAVLDYLTANHPGIRVQQYQVKGYGESVPVAGNDTLEGRAANRRVEFTVLNTEALQRTIESQKLQER